MAEVKRKGLGRGLGALITSATSGSDLDAPSLRQDSVIANDGTALLQLDPRALIPNPHQPRSHFDETSLTELADSIRQDGVHQPIVVRKCPAGFEIISGERRVRASILAGVETIPAVVRDVSDEDMLKFGLVENIQREDLNAIELARAYQELTDRFDWTQDRIALEVGKKRATITNTLRLLNLTPEVQDSLIRGDITMGHARALLAIDGAAAQNRACRDVIEKGLSVRQTEKLGSLHPEPAATRRGSAPANKPDVHLAAVEDELRRRFGTKVRINANDQYRGKIEVDFFNLDELERILDILRS